MTKSKNSVKKSFSVSTRDFDPENEDFGSEVAGVLARNKKGASLTHGHMGDVKSTTSFDNGFNSKKYSGQKVTRKELVKDDFEAFDNSSESDEMESEDFSGDESVVIDSESQEDSSFDDSTSDVSNEDSEVESDYSEATESDTEIKVNFKGSDLSARMRELEMADEGTFELVSHAAQPTEEDAEQKSQHVRNQLVKYDDYVDFRFKLQPLLNSVNRFPSGKAVRQAAKKDSRTSAALEGSLKELEGLMRDLLDLSAAELANDGIAVSSEVNPKACESANQMQGLWDEMTRMDAALDPFARTSLQKWHNKMALSSDLKAKKTLRMLNQDPYQQVQIALQDEERLLARTRILRGDASKKRLGESEQVTDIFDDNDFYQVLLKDWTASHGALSSSTASAMSTILLSGNNNNNNKKHRDNVDPRASKGRKLRYDVHAKLVNYMVPHIEKGAWTDSKIDEFYASLLGQSLIN